MFDLVNRPGKTTPSHIAFTGNPIIMRDNDTFPDQPVMGYPFEIVMDGLAIYRGRFNYPHVINVADIINAYIKKLPEPDSVEPITFGPLTQIEDEAEVACREVIVVFNGEYDEEMGFIALPGGISKQNFRRMGPGRDIFTERFCAEGTNFSWAFVILTYIIFYKTRYGMNVRACGENPGAVAAVGVSVQRIRWSTVLISGFMSGLAGAQISLGYLSMFSENMTSGRGFIALAAIMLSGGRPVAMFVAALLFGVAEGLSNQAQLTTVSSHLILTLPYLMVIVVLLMQPEQMRALKLRIKQMKG